MDHTLVDLQQKGGYTQAETDEGYDESKEVGLVHFFTRRTIIPFPQTATGAAM